MRPCRSTAHRRRSWLAAAHPGSSASPGAQQVTKLNIGVVGGISDTAIYIANDKGLIIRDTGAGRAVLLADRASIPAVRAAALAALHVEQVKLAQDRGNAIAVLADRV